MSGGGMRGGDVSGGDGASSGGDVSGGDGASRGGTSNRILRIRLTDSPISRAGYWWATLVGFAWGFIWSTGPIEVREGLIVFTGMPKWTFGRGGSCVGGCYLTDRNAGDVVLGHEAVHKAQWRTYGMLFPVLYLFAGRNPLRNRFEIEAGLEAGGYVRRGRPVRNAGKTGAAAPAPTAGTRHPLDRVGQSASARPIRQ